MANTVPGQRAGKDDEQSTWTAYPYAPYFQLGSADDKQVRTECSSGSGIPVGFQRR